MVVGNLTNPRFPEAAMLKFLAGLILGIFAGLYFVTTFPHALEHWIGLLPVTGAS